MTKKNLIYLIITLLLLSVGCANKHNGNHSASQGENKPSASRTELLLACITPDSKIQEEIIKFNNSNQEYHITLNDYTQYNYPEAVKQMDLDIISGAPPDIIIISEIDYLRYLNQDILADLSLFYEQEINQADLYTNVLETMRTDGRLYGIVPEFALRVLATGEKALATGEKALPACISFEILNNSTLVTAGKNETLLYWTLFYLHQFVDWEKGVCNFNSPQFFSILERVKNSPEKTDQNLILEKKEAGELIFFPLHLDDVFTYQKYKNFFDGSLICTGYPDGADNLISVGGSKIFALSDRSEQKKAAWDFISRFLKAEYQQENAFRMSGIPISRKALQELLTEAQREQTVEVKDRLEFGNYQEKLYYIDAQTAEEFTRLLDSAFKKGQRYDMKITEIVIEEAGSYLYGSMPAEQVAEKINNRVRIYLQEMM